MLDPGSSCAALIEWHTVWAWGSGKRTIGDRRAQMTALVLVARTALRRQWRGLVVVALLIGVAGAVVLAAAAGARQTSTSLERFRSSSRSADVELDVDQATPQQLAALRRDPAVAAVGRLRQINLVLPNGENLPTASSVDGTFGTVVDRARVIEGRLPRPTSVREVAIGETLASTLHLGVGDRATLDSYSVEQIEQAKAGESPREPQGPKVHFDIVGLVRRPLDLGVLGGFGGVVVPTPAFDERYRDEIGSFVSDLLRVARNMALRMYHGSSRRRVRFSATRCSAWSVSASKPKARATRSTCSRQRCGSLPASPPSRASRRLESSRSAKSELSSAIRRCLPRWDSPRGNVRSQLRVGASSGDRWRRARGRRCRALSPLLPFGLAREGRGGPRLSNRCAGPRPRSARPGVLRTARCRSGLVARRSIRRRRSRDTRRTEAIGGGAFRGVCGSAANGDDRGPHGPRARAWPNCGTGSFGVPRCRLGTLGIVAVLVFSASLDHLVATPRLYGWSWDTVVSTRQDAAGGTAVCGDVKTDVTRDPSFAAVEAICLEAVEVDGHPVTGWAFTALRGSIEPAIVEGRAPRSPDEVALGGAALDAIDKRIGDAVELRGERTKRFRVVGQVVLPPTDTEFAEPLADAAALTGSGLARIYEPISVPNLTFVAQFAAGLDPDRLATTPSGHWKFESGLGLRPSVPVEIDRIRQVDLLPAILGGLLGLLATVAVAHAIVLGIRRRRRDLAVLRTIGFERRDVRATIVYQATTLALLGLLVGVPAGIAVGRAVWRLVAESLGVTTAFDVSLVALDIGGGGRPDCHERHRWRRCNLGASTSPRSRVVEGIACHL